MAKRTIYKILDMDHIFLYPTPLVVQRHITYVQVYATEGINPPLIILIESVSFSESN